MYKLERFLFRRKKENVFSQTYEREGAQARENGEKKQPNKKEKQKKKREMK